MCSNWALRSGCVAPPGSSGLPADCSAAREAALPPCGLPRGAPGAPAPRPGAPYSCTSTATGSSGPRGYMAGPTLPTPPPDGGPSPTAVSFPPQDGEHVPCALGRPREPKGGPAPSSFSPARMVFRARPVALATAATPPYPTCSASAAAHSRRRFSSSHGATFLYLVLIHPASKACTYYSIRLGASNSVILFLRGSSGWFRT